MAASDQKGVCLSNRQTVPTFSETPRAVVQASRAMVAASQPLAVQTGLDILKSGGTAIDAAIAVNAMLGLVEPMSCGLGGDVFAIVWEAATKRLHGLNGSGRSPREPIETDVLGSGAPGYPIARAAVLVRARMCRWMVHASQSIWSNPPTRSAAADN